MTGGEEAVKSRPPWKATTVTGGRRRRCRTVGGRPSRLATPTNFLGKMEVGGGWV